MKFATVYGAPGIRVRLAGLAGIYWPLLLVLFVCGFLLHALLPVALSKMTALLLMAASILLLWIRLGALERRFSRYLKGARGEEIVARELSQLPEGWTVFHSLPRHSLDPVSGGHDFDHVVLGPGALFIVETKNWDGPVQIASGTLSVQGKPVSHSPVAQARREARDLVKALGATLPSEIPVISVICFASNGLQSDTAAIDSTPLCNVRALRNLLLSSPAIALSEERRTIIVSSLLAQ